MGPNQRSWVHKYEHGTLEKDARFRNHTKKRPAMKVAKNKTVDEGYNDFSDEDEEELDTPVPVPRNRRGTKRTIYCRF